MDDGYAHICSIRIDRPAETVLAFLGAPERLSSWAAGMGRARVHEDGLVEGAFPDSGEPIWARIDADRDRNTIHYHLGPEPSSLAPRIEIRVVPGAVLQSDAGSCVVSMIAWRQEGMDDARWRSLKSGHETEILEIRKLVEAVSLREARDEGV